MPYKFEHVGQLAIEPSALALEYDTTLRAPNGETSSGDTAVVCIYGPLVARPEQDPWFDSYANIVERVRCALACNAQRVVLHIDSPGGLVSGCLAAARSIHAMALTAGKPLIAYVGECATSAAYALACAADEIVVPPTGRVGSVGVVEVVPSFARQQQAAGIDVTVLTSGARKADGCPAITMSDDARAALQLGVDRMAEAFFDLVNELRPGKIKDVASLEASVYYGADAVSIGLADRTVATFQDLIASLEAPQTVQGNLEMTRAEIVAGLKALAEGDGEDAEMAKRMLAAEEAPPAEDEKEKEAPEPDAKAAKYDEEAKAAASSALGKTVAALQVKLDKLEKADISRVNAARAELFASRPDVPEALRTALASAPLEQVRAAFAAIPLPQPAAAASTGPTVHGEDRGNGSGGRLPPDQKLLLDRAMGIAKPQLVNRMVGTRFEVGAVDYGTSNDVKVPGVPQIVPEKVIG